MQVVALSNNSSKDKQEFSIQIAIGIEKMDVDATVNIIPSNKGSIFVIAHDDNFAQAIFHNGYISKEFTNLVKRIFDGENVEFPVYLGEILTE